MPKGPRGLNQLLLLLLLQSLILLLLKIKVCISSLLYSFIVAPPNILAFKDRPGFLQVDEKDFHQQEEEIKMKLTKGELFGVMIRGVMNTWIPDYVEKFQQPDKPAFENLSQAGL